MLEEKGKPKQTTHLSIIRLDWCVQLSTCLWVCVPTLPIHSSTHMSIICLSSSDLVPPPPTPSHHTPIHHHPRTHPSNVTQQQVSPLLLPPIRLSLGSFPSVHSSSVLPPSHTNCSVEVIQGTGALPRLWPVLSGLLCELSWISQVFVWTWK